MQLFCDGTLEDIFFLCYTVSLIKSLTYKGGFEMFEDKYRELLEYGNSLGMNELSTREEGGKLFIKGNVPYQMDKNMFWDKIKTHKNWENELSVDVNFDNDDLFGVYTVQPGDSLSKISKWLLGDPMKYMDIFNVNTDVLKNPDNIKVGQKLKLPNPPKPK